MILINQIDIQTNDFGEFCSGLWEKDIPDDDGFKTQGWFAGTIRKGTVDGEYKCFSQTHRQGLFKASLSPSKDIQFDVDYKESVTEKLTKEAARLKGF
ncbi:hypothetical protein AGMMS49942_22300 [Spirochaetia bacterium]|nr:hypothetical protein AGMMS49942_22300 [Spirochaetia bacterium]